MKFEIDVEIPQPGVPQMSDIVWEKWSCTDAECAKEHGQPISPYRPKGMVQSESRYRRVTLMFVRTVFSNLLD